MFDLTVEQIESLVEARQRLLAANSHSFVEDLQVGIGCLTKEGQQAAVKVADMLAARARGEVPGLPGPAGYTSDTNVIAL